MGEDGDGSGAGEGMIAMMCLGEIDSIARIEERTGKNRVVVLVGGGGDMEHRRGDDDDEEVSDECFIVDNE